MRLVALDARNLRLVVSADNQTNVRRRWYRVVVVLTRDSLVVAHPVGETLAGTDGEG